MKIALRYALALLGTLMSVQSATAEAPAPAVRSEDVRYRNGEIELAAGGWSEAEADLTEGLLIAQRIGYPTLTWQCAHALSRALASRAERDRAARGVLERAYEMAHLAADTIQTVVGRLTDPALATALRSWSRVRAVHDDLDRLRRR